jgi:hypothetical protein
MVQQHHLRPRRLASKALLGPNSVLDSPVKSDIVRFSRPQRATAGVKACESSYPEGNELDSSPEFSRCYTRADLESENGQPIFIDFNCVLSRGFFKVELAKRI